MCINCIILLSNSYIEWIKIGTSGFIIALISGSFSIITWFLTKRHYKKQISDQLYIGPILNNLYTPLINEYNRVVTKNINGNNAVLNVNLILSTIQSNDLLINAIPKKIQKKIQLIERLCHACNNSNSFQEKAKRIISELKNLYVELASIYKEFAYDK